MYARRPLIIINLMMKVDFASNENEMGKGKRTGKNAFYHDSRRGTRKCEKVKNLNLKWMISGEKAFGV